MSILSALFARKQKPTESLRLESPPSQERLTGVDLFYRPTLVADLQKEHVLLKQQFRALVGAHKAGDQQHCVEVLNLFTGTLRGHLLKENLHLYVYLKHALSNDEESSALMNSMRQEMQHIGRVLNQFVTSYKTERWDAEIRVRFSSEIEAIHDVLGKRIEAEEKSLYPLYVPPSHYDLA